MAPTVSVYAAGVVEDSPYLYMNDCSVLLRDDAAVFGSHFQSVVRFCILAEELCCSDISSFAVNLKVPQIIIF